MSPTEPAKDLCVIVVARHAERRDYELRDSGGNWVAGASRPWDTPLSTHGWTHQAFALGEHLVGELQRLSLPPITEIYSSPLLRCRQTAAQARNGMLQALKNDGDDAKPLPSKVRVELGLAESINVSWYRSWAIPDADGTWGGPKPPPQTLEDQTTLHPRSLQPIQPLMAMWLTNWNQESRNNETPPLDPDGFDLDYKSGTTIDAPYTYYPRNVETDKEQRIRMRTAVTQLAAQPTSCNNTLLFVSHGAPVTHLFEELTGQDRSHHGTSSYCCYSIYKIDRTRLFQSMETGNGNANDGESNKKNAEDCEDTVLWETVQVNQADFLNEPIVHEKHI